MKLPVFVAAVALAAISMQPALAAAPANPVQEQPVEVPPAGIQALNYPIWWWTGFPEWFGPILPPIEQLACFGPVCGCITVGGIRICV